MAQLGDGDRQRHMLEFVTTGKGPVPDLSGAHGQVDAHNLLIFEEGLAFDAHFLHSGEIYLVGLTNAQMGTCGHMWAQMEDGPKKNLAHCVKKQCRRSGTNPCRPTG